jgi:glycosyltransferase involved in cell wall biosynthesis
MSQLPLISVVIPCYQQAQFLAEAVQSALDPNYPTKEVVVVNDGSPDDTREVAARFGERIVYVEQANKGLSGARNAGIRAAHGEYVALLDSDDICLPGRLATQAAILQERPDVGMVASDALLYDGQQVIGPKSAVSGQPKHPTDFRWETVEYCATPSTALIRRECFAAIGYFNERVRGGVGSGGEDWLLFVQLSLRYALVYQTFPTILYRLHPHSGTRNLEGVNAGNRQACQFAVNWPYFPDYPAAFRAKLLFYRFATAWRVEPRAAALRYLLRAIAADPAQLPYGTRVIRRGIANALRRQLG